MFQIDKLIYREPNFLSKDDCKRLINSFNKNKSYQETSMHATKEKLTNATFDTYDITPDKKEEFNYIKNITKLALNNYYKYLKSSGNFHYDIRNILRYSHRYRILKYNIGASIHPHIDFSPYTFASIVFNLNENYKGGEFSFFNGKLDLNLKQGEVMIFPASHFWVHEVKEITEGVRYSINSFISSVPHEVKNKINKISSNLENEYLNSTSKNEILGPYILDK